MCGLKIIYNGQEMIDVLDGRGLSKSASAFREALDKRNAGRG